jgi:hypothetical protein
VELFAMTPITEDAARVHVQRAWYVALGSGAVMLLGGLFTLSFNLVMGGVIVIGLGHGMIQRSWVAAGALLLYLVGVLMQAGWSQSQPVLVLLAAGVGYFLAHGVRATWWWRGRSEIPYTPLP